MSDDTNIIEEAQEEAKEEEVVEIKSEDVPVKLLKDTDQVVVSEIGRELGVETKETTKYDRDLKLLMEYAVNRGAKNLNDVLWEIRQLKNKVGKEAMGDSIKKYSRYAYLYNESVAIEKEMARYG